MTGKKFDDGKPRYDLIPPVVLEQLATVLTFGAKKYGPNNWQSVPDAQNRYYSALMRHVEADRGGEVFDEESGLPHLTHALACVAFMLHGRMVQPEVVQRPGCKVPPELEPLLEWLGPSVSSVYLDNVGDADRLKALVEGTKQDRYLARAFVWSSTDEGKDYWASVNEKWLAHLREEKAPTLKSLDELYPMAEFFKWLGPVNESRYLEYTPTHRLKSILKAPYSYLNSAFVWNIAPEGAEYWRDLNVKWLDHLAKKEQAGDSVKIVNIKGGI